MNLCKEDFLATNNSFCPGSWTGVTPTCRPISCGEPPMLPKSAVALINGSSQWKSVAQYSCLPGFMFLHGKW